MIGRDFRQIHAQYAEAREKSIGKSALAMR